MPKTLAPMTFDQGKHSKATLLKLYEDLLRPRMIEEKMLVLLRQGKVSKWFSGIGQEAISVGVTSALLEDEFVFTLHRNLGVFTTRNMPLGRLFAQWQGTNGGYTKGRDRSFHFGAPEHHIVGMISHLGPQLALADGVALAHKLAGEGRIAVAFSGEGGTSEGDFHEALNTAAVWDLPVIFVIENNGYGLSTPTNEQFRCANLADKGIGYGMKSLTIDGNNILEVYNTVQQLAKEMRKKPAPVLLECMTFRMRGHEEASGTKYVPQHHFDEWALKDPIATYEHFLLEKGILTAEKQAEIRKGIQSYIETELAKAFAETRITPNVETELADVYAPYVHVPAEPGATTKEMRFVDAISDGLAEAMTKHDNLVLMGQDIAEYGGVFKITDGFVKRFGSGRVRNTPLCESAIIGVGLGLSIKGFKAMVEMQFSDFVTCGFNQIVNNLAKLHYRWGANADVVVRMPAGGGMAAGPFHSQTNEAWFFHTPGLKIVYPSTPADAKGLLLAAFADPNPVLFFEHKGLYRKVAEQVSEGYYTYELGKARIAKTGSTMSIVTYGMGVHWALEACAATGIDAEIIDLRTLSPLDYATIEQSLRKTSRALILHEANLTGGVGAELAAYISEHCFEDLDAPVMRVAALDTPIPFAPELENQYMPPHRLVEQMQKLAAF